MMEVSQESQVNCEEGGDIVYGLTRKDEPLYKVHKPQFLRIFPEEVITLNLTIIIICLVFYQLKIFLKIK